MSLFLFVNFLCERWDALSDEERQAEVDLMPEECHRCRNKSVASGGTAESLAPDPHWGYTKLFCGVCAKKVLLAHRGREGGDGALLDFAQAKEAGNAAAKKGDWAGALGHYVRSLTLPVCRC